MNQIKIFGPKAGWTGEFQSLSEDLLLYIGSTAARIDHIGSTSVEGLAAKDIIDIQINVDSLADSSIEEKLTKAGYIFKREIQSDNLMGLERGSKELRNKYFRENSGRELVQGGAGL